MTDALILTVKFALRVVLIVTKGVRSTQTNLALKWFLSNLLFETATRLKMFVIVSFCE